MIRILLILSLLSSITLWSQQTYFLSIHQAKEFQLKKDFYTFKTKKEVETFLQQRQFKLIKRGFVLASIDSLNWKNDTAYVQLYKGEKFENIRINIKKEDEYIIKKTPSINEKIMGDFPFSPRLVQSMLKNISAYLNNTGYPFSKVFLKIDSLQIKGSHAQLIIEKGPLVKITQIFVKGDQKINKKFVQNIISIKEGHPYNSDLIRGISRRIEQVQFIKEIKPAEILFKPEGAELYVYLKNNPVSLINGIIGIQPDPTTKKTTVTGDVRLKLQNLLKRGELLDINWRSYQPQTQELKLRLNYPFMFNTPFGIDTKFNLYKRDSSYLTLNFHAGMQYFLLGGSYLKVFYELDNSNLLQGTSSSTTGEFSTVKSNNYGISFFYNKVDYIQNPSKGLLIEVESSAGIRKSKEAGKDTTLTSTTFKGRLDISVFIPLVKRHIIRLSNTTQTYYAPNIFKNELYRFGGLNTQRGFSEESLLATTLSVFSIEYRFLVDKNSHAFAFFDQTFYENTAVEYRNDHPYGFGLGYSFGTKIGIFSISYALGSQQNNPIQIRDSKIHFGYIAYF